MSKTALLCALALAAGVCAAAEAPFPLAIRNARVVPVSGPILAKATVVVRDGLILDIGENAVIPPGAWIIDGDGLTVYPGLIDALDSAGITDPNALPAAPEARRPGPGPAAAAVTAAQPARGPEDRPATASWLRAADLVKPSDPRVGSLRNFGFTTAVSFPMRGIFAGQGAVIELAGDKGGEMIVSTPAAEYLTLASGGFASFPGSLMGVIAYIRQVYLDASHNRAAAAAYAQNHTGIRRPDYDRALEGVLEPPRILLPARRKVEMERMIRFANELHQSAVLYGMDEAYRAAPELKASGVPVLVSLKWPEKPRDSDPNGYETLRTLEVRDKAPSSPAALAKAGVRFAFYSDGLANATEIKRAVRRALDAGLSQADALRAMTLAPAEIYGVADRLGTIEKGKIANLVVTKGDLFGEKTEVKFIIVDGRKFEPEPEPESPGGPPGAASRTGPGEEGGR